jgi:hypothetical protein
LSDTAHEEYTQDYQSETHRRYEIERDIENANRRRSELVTELKPRYQRIDVAGDDWRVNMLQRAGRSETQAVEDVARWKSIRDEQKRLEQELG